jgi:hypothetical protein
MNTIYIAFFKGQSWIEKIIRFFTGKYSHSASLMLNLPINTQTLSPTNDNLAEFWGLSMSFKDLKNMEIRWSSFTEHGIGTPVDIYSLTLTEEQYTIYNNYIIDSIHSDKRYNWLGVFSLGIGISHASKNKAFCSEQIWLALQEANVPFTKGIKAASIDPTELANAIIKNGGKLEFSGTVDSPVMKSNGTVPFNVPQGTEAE